MLNAIDRDHSQIQTDKKCHYANQGPAAGVSCLGVRNHCRENDQKVAADNDETIVDQLKVIRLLGGVGPHVPRVDHHQRALEDDRLDLEVALVGRAHQYDRKQEPSEHEDKW